VTPDHLARHKTMANYARMKGRIFRHSTSQDVAVLNKEDKWCRMIGRGTNAKKSWFPNSTIIKLARHIKLPGEHNLQNAMAAALAAQAVGIQDSCIRKALQTFPGVPHRLELIRERRGVRYINDSKGTNVDSTFVALKAATRPTILILGGEHKGSPYTPLIPLIRKKVKEVLTIGEAAPIIARDLGGTVKITPCGNLARAIIRASQLAGQGEDVLLSPACASFDQYKNFEERGRHFARLVRALK
jgi:UDP-N-acetylmuramoylalanine--D-glutamate ligase